MFASTAHRPWPLPRAPWIMAMQWHNLLFMHWPVPVATLRPWIPHALSIDTYDSMAWIGIVPFQMAGVRPRAGVALPWLSAFPELNVRTYVTLDNMPGVWFFSLDAGNPLAVEGARNLFHLNYYNARMRCTVRNNGITYNSVRTHISAPMATLAVEYGPTGPVERARSGTLEHWLTERYCLYAANRRGTIWRGDIHHESWPLQPAAATIENNTMTAPIGLALPDLPPLLHFARRLDVVAWAPRRCRV